MRAAELTSVMAAALQEHQQQQQQQQQLQQQLQQQEEEEAAAVRAQGGEGGEGGEGGVLPEWARPYSPPSRRQALLRRATGEGRGSGPHGARGPACLSGRTAQEGLPAGAASGGGGAAAAAVLVAHEHAIRGIDLPQVDLVILTMLPDSAESYMHMAGRTGRAGRPGDAVCIFTERELEESGALTRALRVKWRMRRWLGDGGLERWSHSSARSRPASA